MSDKFPCKLCGSSGGPGGERLVSVPIGAYVGPGATTVVLCSDCVRRVAWVERGRPSPRDAPKATAPSEAATAPGSGFTPGDLVMLQEQGWGVLIATCGPDALVWTPLRDIDGTTSIPPDRTILPAHWVVTTMEHLRPFVLPATAVQRSE